MKQLRTLHSVQSGLAALCTLTLMLIGPQTVAYASSALDGATRERAQLIARRIPWASPRANSIASHPLKTQTLTIEKQERKSTAATPLVRVYQFDYSTQQSRLLVINPDTSDIVQNRLIDTVHLPLNQVEIAYATQLLSQSGDTVLRLQDEQRKRGREAFGTIDELDVKASIHEPLDSTHPCYTQRCALMSLFDDTHTVFTTEPIVNLQTLQILMLNNR